MRRLHALTLALMMTTVTIAGCIGEEDCSDLEKRISDLESENNALRDQLNNTVSENNALRDQLNNATPLIPYFISSSQDAQGSPGAGADDALVYVVMTDILYGYTQATIQQNNSQLTTINGNISGINWAYVKVSISVDEGPVKECANAQAAADASNDCVISGDGETGDNEWSVGDEIIISENGQPLCSGSCSVTVVLYDTNAGKEMQTIQNIAVS